VEKKRTLPRPTRLGLIGCGNIAHSYLEWIRTTYPAQLAVVTCVDVDHVRARELGRTRELAAHFGLEVASDLDALLARDDVEIVLNLTTPPEHADVTLATLAAGKHVYSEKPLALTLADADRITTTARERDLAVACAPAIMLGAPQRAAWRWIREGRLGPVHEVILSVTTSGHEAWHPHPRYFYRPGAGPVLDLGVYPLTVATTILGPIVRVWGQGGLARPEREVATGPHAGERFSVEIPADHITGLLQFEGGTTGTLHTSYAAAQTHLPPVEMQGAIGSLWIDDFHRFDAGVHVCLRGESAWRQVAVPGPEAAPNWARAIVDLAEAVEERRQPRMSAEQAAHVLEVMLGIEQSAREGTRPVEVTRRFARPVPLDEPIGWSRW
jgi:predicted dehydrogenase